MSEHNLQEKFPEMQPIKSPPVLTTINGIGLSIYGARDHDPETGTYVKTQCFALLFIPILALRAFRVADAEAGWYFIGRVPLSPFAKSWNCLVLATALGLGGFFLWHHHVSSPEYLAEQKLKEGEQLAETGQIGKAAQAYREVALGNTVHAGTALGKIKELVDGPVGQAGPADAAAVLKVAMEFRQRPGAADNLFERGLDWVKRQGEVDPEGALIVIDAVAAAAPNKADLNKTRQKLLEPLVARNPDKTDFASRLAEVYESQDQLPKCEALLKPHQERLGVSEGARILGQILAHQGNFDQSYRLLQPYAEGRLQKLHAAEKVYNTKLSQAHARIIEQLQQGTAGNFPFERYKIAGKAEQDSLVQDYVASRLKDDADLNASQEALLAEGKVVPVALDLGIVLLRRGQAMEDAAARRAELEKAEKTFLAVRGIAGESDQFRLFLGQVYYWLGKHTEGRKLFDELLEANQRSFETLLSVSGLLRQLGVVPEARKLAEEAHAKESAPKKKYEAASLRAVMNTDLDDEIAWLGRSDPDDLHVKANLSWAMGNKAMRDGKDGEAAAHLRQAIDGYARLHENATTLNNGAIAYLSLFQVTGDREALMKGMEMLEKAVALMPSDSILLGNAAHSILESALRDIIGSKIDLKLLKMEGSLDMLSYLYQDAAGKEPFLERVQRHSGVAKALAHYERLQVLSSKGGRGYSGAYSIHSYTRNLPELRRLAKRVEESDLDLSDAVRVLAESYSGKKDDKKIKETQAAIAGHEILAATARKGPRGPTLAVAATTLAQDHMTLVHLGQPVNADALVALAEEAHEAAPSSATQATLIAALLTRAGLTLTRQEPLYAEMASRSRRSLGDSYLVALALTRAEKLQAATGADKDVQRAVSLLLEQTLKFPDNPSEWEWAMLWVAHPGEAEKIAKTFLENEKHRLDRSISRRLSAPNPTHALDDYWAKVMTGREAEGIEILKRCASQGIPLPFDPK